MTRRPLPPVQELTRAQFDGWACVWCRTPLWKGATSAGRARGRMGDHVLDIEVYACPVCGPTPTISSPSPRSNQEATDGVSPSSPRATVQPRRKS